MFQFKVEIVLIGIRAKTDLFDHNFKRLRLNLFLLLLLLVLKLRIVGHFANRRISVRRNLNQVKILLFCYFQRILQGINIHGYVLTYQPYSGGRYPFINFVRLFRPLWASSERPVTYCTDTVLLFKFHKRGANIALFYQNNKLI